MHTRIQPSEVFLWQQGPIFLPYTGHHTTRFDLMHPRPPEEGKGCAQLLIIIIITTTTIIINKRRKKIKQDAMKDYLRQHLAVASLAEIENIYLYTGKIGRLETVVWHYSPHVSLPSHVLHKGRALKSVTR